MAIMKMCGKPGCMKHIPHTDTYCNKHVKDKKAYDKKNSAEYDRIRRLENPAYMAFYSSKAWKELRKTVMMEHDWLCAHCLLDDVVTKANVCDHIVEVSENWERRLDKTNLQCLCFTCHQKKTFKERERRNKQ